MSAPIILSLETATLGGSVWLGEGTRQLASRNGDPKVSQSASLLNDIQESLDDAGIELTDVNLFACASGPGSFTGLRIGIATLKALAASLERPCVGIPTLHAVAHAAGPSRATVALLPAGRGEVFAQMFCVSRSGVVTEVDRPAHLSPRRLIEKYGATRKVIWAGSGAYSQREILKGHAQRVGIAFSEEIGAEGVGLEGDAPSLWQLAPPQTNLAKDVAALALELYETGAIQSPHSLSAIYVRPSDAELNQKCR